MGPTRVLSQVGPLPAVAAALPDIDIIPIPSDGPVPTDARGPVLVTVAMSTPNLAEAVTHGVEWVHVIGTGVEGFPFEVLDGRPLTCSRGANAAFIAEWVMAQLLTAAKRLPEAWVHQPPEQWGGPELGTLQGATVALFGVGTIGAAIARRTLPFGAQVRALRRQAGPAPVEGIAMVRSVDELVDRADHVVLAAPLTNATRGVVNERFLAAIKPGAHLVNISRAGLVDDGALRAALDSGRLGLASLDVAPVEPLPAGHWYYEHPQVRFSAHCSYSGPGVWELIEQVLVDNLRRWQGGQPLSNVVDIENGY